MGAHRAMTTFLKRVGAGLLIFLIALFFPWFIAVGVALIVVLMRLVSLEVIFIGALLDVILISSQGGFEGFFYTLIFLAIYALSELINVFFKRDE